MFFRFLLFFENRYLQKCSSIFVSIRRPVEGIKYRFSTFKSHHTKKIYKIFHNVNCTSSWVIYLMEWVLFNKQFVGKAEISVNIRLKHHRKDLEKVDTITACKHFQQESHNFNKHAKLTIIDQLRNTTKAKETLIQQLIKRENFWILKLDTLYPEGFNTELSK